MNYKRKKSRVKSRSSRPTTIGSRTGEASSWWNIIKHSRPGRRRAKLNCVKILTGSDSEAVIWDLGNRKPHIHYW